MLSERIGKVMNLVIRLHHKMEANCNVSRAQMFMLKYIAENGNHPVYQKELEEKFGIRASTASEIINNLESKGFVERRADKTDARKKQIVLTNQAKEFDAQMYKHAADEEKRVLNGVTKEELKVLNSVIDKVEKNLNDMLESKS